MGPSVSKQEVLSQLIDKGMSVARLNFSHGTHESHLETINLLKKIRKQKNKALAIMLDTKGPEIRIGKVPGDMQKLEVGDLITLKRPGSSIDPLAIEMSPEMVFDFIKEGMVLLFDDGYISAKVVTISPVGIVVEVLNAGVLKNQKGVNIPGENIPLPAMTAEDRASICFGAKHDVDFIAASFIRSKEHLLEIRELLALCGKSDIKIIAKIEDPQGVKNFDEILSVSDGIMVARGDLGVELPLQEVPSLQKQMIRKCYDHGKPVVTATQMLESMIKSPRPTRAEVSDVANAIYDSTSAVMLSGETAAGLYPIETVYIMNKIIVEAESQFDYFNFLKQKQDPSFTEISTAIAFAAVKTAYAIQAKAIFVFTSSGLIVREISRFRPKMPILAFSSNEKTYHQLSLYWGVIPVPPEPMSHLQEALKLMKEFAINENLVKKQDIVVVTAGVPFGVKGSTNTMFIEEVR